MDLDIIICDIKEKLYKSRAKILGGNYYETQEYRDVKFSIPKLDEYIVCSSGAKHFEEIIFDLCLLSFFIVVTFTNIKELLYSYWLICYLFLGFYFISKLISHIYYYKNPKNLLRVNKISVKMNEEIEVKWKYVLALHFYEYHGRGTSLNKLLVHYLDENKGIQKIELNLKYLNYNPKQICNILSQFYLYENVYRTDF